MDRVKLERIAGKALLDFGKVNLRGTLADETKKRPGNGFLTGKGLPPWLKKYTWKPGCPSPNPSGYHGTTKISTEIKHRLAQIEPTTGFTYAKLIAIAMVDRAIHGDVWAAKEIREVTEGVLKQKVELQHDLTITQQQVKEASEEDLNAIIESYLERTYGGRRDEGKSENNRPTTQAPD